MRVLAKIKSAGPLPCIVLVLLASGTLRIGGVGFAIANEPPVASQSTAFQDAGRDQAQDAEIQALLEVIRKRTADLDAREAQLVTRANDLKAAQQAVEQNLRRLQEAEARLTATISKVDGASEDDLDRLTRVYESMKPKVAAELFEQMQPDFAAGFLGRMNPEAAAGIMSGLSTETGYAISVVLAGRNARAPDQ